MIEMTIEELAIIDQAFEYISDVSGLKPEELELWDRIKEVLKYNE